MALHCHKSFAVSCTSKAIFLLLLIFGTYLVHRRQALQGGVSVDKRLSKDDSLIIRKLLAQRQDENPENDANDTADDGATTQSLGTGSPGNDTDEEHECTPPAYHEFPPDAFTEKQREQGAIILHALVVMYMFAALAIVCDEYFVSSLEKICEKLHLSEDVAGATFMAAGSSAPELFTSIIGVFIAKGDVGVGTIVGSAVFNILFVIGICGVLTGQIVMLSWWPLLRDSSFYAFSVIALMGAIYDSQIRWYEAFFMLILYILYILIMIFNPRLQAWAIKHIHIFGDQPEDTTTILSTDAQPKYYGNYEIFDNEDEGKKKKVLAVDEYVLKSNKKLSFEDACFRFMKQKGFRPKTRFWSAAKIIILERRKLLADPVFLKRQKWKTYSYDSEATSYCKAIRSSRFSCIMEEEGENLDQWLKPPALDKGVLYIVRWVVTYPLNLVLYFTVPDCRKSRWERWYMASFIISIAWIAIFSYIMVWMVTLIGYTLGIPDSIMGITFLAAGTSVPDAMASVMVARQGQGDMAVSNTIGSNVFDILIGLALPWFLKTAMVSAGSAVHINSNGMVFSVILLFLTVILTIAIIHFGGWKLDRKIGVILLIAYAVFVIFSILIEFNVFGYVNPPMCRE